MKSQECQRNLSAIHIERYQNTINNVAWGILLVGALLTAYLPRYYLNDLQKAFKKVFEVLTIIRIL